MADLQSPTNPHFFQSLLLGFHSHLNIPVKFFSVYMEEKNEGKTVELRSDASEKTWKVKTESRKLTQGWKEFAIAHDFQTGDIIVFRHDGDMVFHVTCLGPSFCEIQYVHSSDNDNNQNNIIRNLSMEQSLKTKIESSLDQDDKDKMGKFPRMKPMKKKISETKADSFSSDQYCFVAHSTNHCSKRKRKTDEKSKRMSSWAVSETRFVTLNVTPASLNSSRLYLPRSFTTLNKLENVGGKKATLLDKHGVEWPVNIVMEKRYTRLCLGSGLKDFFKAIDVKACESFVLELIREGTTTTQLLLKFCSKFKT